MNEYDYGEGKIRDEEERSSLMMISGALLFCAALAIALTAIAIYVL